MIELREKENTAKVFIDNIEATVIGQIIGMLNEGITKDAADIIHRLTPLYNFKNK